MSFSTQNLSGEGQTRSSTPMAALPREIGEFEHYKSGTGVYLVYRPASDIGLAVQLCVDPIGDFPGSLEWATQYGELRWLNFNTPLALILHTRSIATDSLCAMYMLSKHLSSPRGAQACIVG